MLPDALLALWLKLLVDGVVDGDGHRVHHRRRRPRRVGDAPPGTCRVLSQRVQRRFRDRVAIALESHVAHLQASVPTIEHHERPEYLDRLAMLRDQVFALDHMFMSLFSTLGWMFRLAITAMLLASIHPAAGAAAAVRAARVLRRRRGGRPSSARVEESVIANTRLARHLFVLGTTAPPAKEVRVTGTGDWLVSERRAAWDRWYEPVVDGALGHRAVAHGGVGGVRRRRTSRPSCSSSTGLDRGVGDVVLVVAAGTRLVSYIGATAGELGFLRGLLARLVAAADVAGGLRGAARVGGDCHRAGPTDRRHPLRPRLVPLPGHRSAGARRRRRCTCRPVPWWPSSARTAPASRRWSSCWPACTRRRRVASPSTASTWPTSPPTSGGRAWPVRSRTSSASSCRPADRRRRRPAAPRRPAGGRDRGRSGRRRTTWSSGWPTASTRSSGPTWDDGAEVSFGQWQKLALARGFMRDEPLLLILDEPTAALDAETEHALFERFADAARATRRHPAGSRCSCRTASRRCAWPT